MRGLGALGLALAAGCAPATSSPAQDSPASPQGTTSGDDMQLVLGAEELVKHLEPREGDTAVVLNLWATWCPPCVAEMPDLVKLHQKHGGEGVRVVAVSIDLPMPRSADTAEEVFDFAESKGFHLPIVALDADYDETVALMERWNAPGGIPFTVVMNREGEAVATHEGKASLEDFEEMIAKAER